MLARHRFYQPQTGRWLKRDPIGYAGGMNLYEYAGDDPVNEVDPDGTDVAIGPRAAPWIDFTSDDVGSGLAVGLASTGSAVTWDHWDGGKYKNDPSFEASHTFAVIGREAAVQAVGGKLIELGTKAFVTARLAAHIAEAERTAQLTIRQGQAVLRRPSLLGMFKGERIDTAVKAAVGNDRMLRPFVRVTPRFVAGPDVIGRGSIIWGRRWWDLTVNSAWAEHVARYGCDFGRGVGIFWK